MENKEIQWNLALERISDDKYKIIMPNEDGSVNSPDKGYLVRWPVYPGFTGINIIACILADTPQFKNCQFITEE